MRLIVALAFTLAVVSARTVVRRNAAYGGAGAVQVGGQSPSPGNTPGALPPAPPPPPPAPVDVSGGDKPKPDAGAPAPVPTDVPAPIAPAPIAPAPIAPAPDAAKPDAAAPVAAGPDASAPDATQAPTGATCKVPERPVKQEGCTWVPTYDDQFCITGFECGAEPTPAPAPAPASSTDGAAAGGDGAEGGAGAEGVDGAEGGAVAERKCKDLNPLTESDVDVRGSDPGCETGNPGWGGDETCRCKYTVKTRGADGCPTRFWRTCKKGGEDGTDPFGPDGATPAPCPPLEFPEEQPGCMFVKMADENGCDAIMNMCPDGATGTDSGAGGSATATGAGGSAIATGDGGSATGTSNGGAGQVPAVDPVPVQPPQPQPPQQIASGYRQF